MSGSNAAEVTLLNFTGEKQRCIVGITHLYKFLTLYQENKQ